jgi:hypothetical protein
VKASFTDKQLAVNLNKAILQTTSECDGKQIKDLIIDCADRRAISCIKPGSGTRVSSCDFLDYQIPKLFNMTLDTWGSSYEYKITLFDGQNDVNLFSISTRQNCRDGASVVPGIFPLPLRSGQQVQQVYSTIKICR